VVFDVAPDARDSFPKIVTKAFYDEMFGTAKAPYSYDGFVAAVAKYGAKFGGTFAGEKTALDRKHEVAAFLAHVAHETGSLTLAEEQVPDASVEPYHGRGALQLTLQANYQSAEQAGFAGIVADPKKVAETADYAFGTALWFWMTPRSAKGVCHTAIMNNDFAMTTNIINGGIECNADPNSKQFSRIKLFRQFTAAMGVNTGGVKLTCP
jgi:predicted chitinase